MNSFILIVVKTIYSHLKGSKNFYDYVKDLKGGSMHFIWLGFHKNIQFLVYYCLFIKPNFKRVSEKGTIVYLKQSINNNWIINHYTFNSVQLLL